MDPQPQPSQIDTVPADINPAAVQIAADSAEVERCLAIGDIGLESSSIVNDQIAILSGNDGRKAQFEGLFQTFTQDYTQEADDIHKLDPFFNIHTGDILSFLSGVSPQAFGSASLWVKQDDEGNEETLAAYDAILNEMQAKYPHLVKVLCHFITLIDCFAPMLDDGNDKHHSTALRAGLLENMESGVLVCYQGFRNRLMTCIMNFLGNIDNL